MLDPIQDRSARELYDIILDRLVLKHGEDSIPARFFEASVSLYLEHGDDTGLEAFLQHRWDELE